jgi:hypothetical protein
MKREDDKPWYKYGFVWLMIGLPASAVIAGITTVFIATHEPDSMVVDDYYKDGLAINTVIEKDRRAIEMELGARLEFGNSGVRLYMQSPEPIAEGPLTLKLIHPTRAEQDQQLVLVPFGDNYYEASGLESLAAVTWEVQIADNQGQWRMVKKQRLVDNPVLVISP